MKIFLAIVLLFHYLTAAPIPGFNVNFLRTDAQKLEHYDIIVAALKKELLSFSRYEATEPRYKLLKRIVDKTAKRNRLRPFDYIPAEAREFDRIVEEAIELLIQLSKGGTLADVRKSRHYNRWFLLSEVVELFNIGPRRVQDAREKMRKLRDTIAYWTKDARYLYSLGTLPTEHPPSERVVTPVQTVTNRPLATAAKLQLNMPHFAGEVEQMHKSNINSEPLKSEAANHPPPTLDLEKEKILKSNIISEHQSADAEDLLPNPPPTDNLPPVKYFTASNEYPILLKSLQILTEVSTEGMDLPTRIKPQVMDYEGILKIASGLVIRLQRENIDDINYFNQMLTKMKKTSPDNFLEARAQLDKMWIMLRAVIE